MQAKYRQQLPQLGGKRFVTDGGLETALIFLEGLDLPQFAAFVLLDSEQGRTAIDRYMRGFGEIALRQELGFIMDTPTWRASARWANELGISEDHLRDIHQRAVEYLLSLRDGLETASSPFVLNGAIGPQDDGYRPDHFMTTAKAQSYHAQQVDWFAEFGADMVTAVTMTYVEEALGIAAAAKAARIPCAVSFTVETDGKLPSGQNLQSAIEQVDRETNDSPVYYMINCAHPEHFSGVLKEPGQWRERIRGVRANASRMSHEELDNANELDDGDPMELAAQYSDMMQHLPNLVVMGGCCGTDHRHIDAISRIG